MMKTFKLFFALMLFSFEGITQPF
ncbi:MAG: hypothetical protein RL447_731, partial [Bacteroidota bacterium]